MWIRGQNREVLVHVSQVSIQKNKKNWSVEGESVSEGYETLGEYSSEDLAKEEINRIFRALKSGETTYTMSEDESVIY